MPTKQSRATKAANKAALQIESPPPAAERKQSGAPPANFLFAGDFNVQSIRYETKSAFPVHRYGNSYEVHRHKCFSGPFLLKHLVEQCFDYLGVSNLNAQDVDLTHPNDDPAPDKVGKTNSKRICKILQKVQEKRQKSIISKIWQRAEKNDNAKINTGDPVTPGNPKETVPLTVYHESVSIIRDIGMREKAGQAPSDCLFAPRIHDSHSITHSQPLPEIFNVDVKAFGTSILSKPDIVLSLDLNPSLAVRDFKLLKNHYFYPKIIHNSFIISKSNR